MALKKNFLAETLLVLAKFVVTSAVGVRSGLLVDRGKKSQISRDFQGQILGKNGRFRGNFAGVFEASFIEKWLVKNGRFRGSFRANFAGKQLVLC